MHNTVKLTALICLILICSCTANPKIKTKTENITNETEEYSINCESFSAEDSTDGLKALNGIFANELEAWTSDFLSRASGISTKGSSLPCLQVRHIVKKNDDKFISIITEKYVYLNGMHGNTWLSAKNFDIAKDSTVTLSELFTDNTYPQILEERMQELIAADNELYHDLWEQPAIDRVREDKFYLDDKNLVIFYEPYELSYYARGVVEFPIPYEKIRGYIKPEYLPSR